jgi:hypothetical protein
MGKTIEKEGIGILEFEEGGFERVVLCLSLTKEAFKLFRATYSHASCNTSAIFFPRKIFLADFLILSSEAVMDLTRRVLSARPKPTNATKSKKKS